jgi:hypothetical protein
MKNTSHTHELFFQTECWNRLWEKTWPKKFKVIQNEGVFGCREFKFSKFFYVDHWALSGCYGQLNDGGQKVKFLQNHDNILTILNQISANENVPLFTQMISDHFKSSSAHLRAVKKAQKSGLMVKKISFDVNFISEYYSLYQNTLERWNLENRLIKKIYPLEFFMNMAEIPEDLVDFWVVYQNEKLIASSIWFKSSAFVHYWHGVSDSSLLELRANDFMFSETIQYYRSLDFVVDLMPSSGNQGVVDFKTKLGAQKYPVEQMITKGFLRKGIELCRKIIKS